MQFELPLSYAPNWLCGAWSESNWIFPLDGQVVGPLASVDAGLDEAGIEEHLKQFLLVLSVSLGVASLPNIFGWFRSIPYTLLLVIVGLVLAFLDVRLVALSPGLILSIFLPPLLFEAAWNFRWQELRRYLVPISLYAVFGVVVTIIGMGLGIYHFSALSLTTALLIGASLSATDPVSVIALFRELGVGQRLSTLTEGESLFNDGMAVVAFGFVLALTTHSVEPSAHALLLKFLQVAGVGAAVGTVLGSGVSRLTQRFDLPLVEQSLTLVAAYAAYLIAEDLGGSGVISVVITGLILGNFGSRIGMSPRTRAIVTEFWEFLAFFVNSIVFLLIGDQVRFSALINNLGLIGITIGAMVLARAVAVLLLSGLSNLLTQEKVPLAEQVVLWWAGLRGSVSIALALSIYAALPERQTVISTVFGVVLFTLLVQGMTIKPLLQSLKLLGDQPLYQQYSEAVARLTALQRVLDHLNTLDERSGVDPEFIRDQAALLEGEITQLESKIQQLQSEHPGLTGYATDQLKQELLAVEANTYAEFVQRGRLSQELAPYLPTLSEQVTEA